MPSKAKAKKKTVHRHTLGMLEKIAIFTEQSRLDEYIDLMQKPLKLAWLNFWAGVWRGLGMVMGTVVVFALVIFLLKRALTHAGGVPWIGAQVEEGISWVLNVVEKRGE